MITGKDGREYALVPKGATPEMLGAWYRYKNGFHFPNEPAPRDTSDDGAYCAMTAARPPYEPSDEVVERVAIGLYLHEHKFGELTEEIEEVQSYWRASARAAIRAFIGGE